MASACRPAPRRLRVAYLVNQYPKVSHSFIRREILALERQGVAVERFAVRGWDDELPDAARPRRARAHPLPAAARPRRRCSAPALRDGGDARRSASRGRSAWRRSTWRRSSRPCSYHLVYLAEACRLVRWLTPRRVDHLHAHFGTNPAEVAMLARELGGPPYSFTVHGPEEFDQPAAPSASARRSGARRSSSPISSFGRSQLYRWVPARRLAARSQVVHCGLEPAFHAARRRRPPAAPRLVCVGRLCEQKGQLLLVEAAQPRRRAGACRSSWCSPATARCAPRSKRCIDALGLQRERAHHRLDRQRPGARRDPGGARAGAAELRRRPAGRHHGGDGAAAGR